MSEDQTDVSTLPAPIQGGDEPVKRQSGIDSRRADLANDPLFNMPVIQGSPEIFTTRQTGLPQNSDAGVMQADRPREAQRVAYDRAIPVDYDAGMPDHPGVVPGNPNMYGDKALPEGHVYQGAPEPATRQPGLSTEDKAKARAAAKKAAEDHGFLVSDSPISKDTDAGYPGHPGVVPGNPAALAAEQAAAKGEPDPAPVQGGAEEVKRNEGMVFKADTGAADPRNPDGGTTELKEGDLPVIKKAPIVPVLIADHPAPPGTVSVHDPMQAMREQGEATTAAHPLKDDLPVVDEDDSDGKKKSKKAAKS